LSKHVKELNFSLVNIGRKRGIERFLFFVFEQLIAYGDLYVSPYDGHGHVCVFAFDIPAPFYAVFHDDDDRRQHMSS